MKRPSLKRKGWVICALLALIIVFSVTKSHAKKITIKLTTIQMPKQQMGKACLKFGKTVNSKLGDRVKVKVYPSAQLYRSKEEIEALMRNEIDMSFVIGSKLEVLDPSLQAFKLPFLFPDVKTAYALIDGEIGSKLFAKLPGQGLQFLGLVNAGNVVLSNSKRPLLMPDDFKGLKMRSFGRMGKDTLEALGAQAVVTASSETFSALQQGVIDGLATPNSVYLKRKYETIQKYVTDGGMINFTNIVLLANNDFWKGLPDDLRVEIKKVVDDLISEMRREMDEKNQQIFNKIREAGNEVHTLTPEQVVSWKKALQSVYDKYGPEIGLPLIEKMKKKIAELNS
ncbi:MAG: TRAP transporter substrate-binding protein DctP [Deltaproteobacteria bacterium]|nr:TRAP transporter substrate-binding protein DctP [Deltaproteobacteria bacterium]MBW2129946.1 TRAP transporter substrate-binding protein DctP [Deltaproteobacteria bacterium]